MIRLTEKFLAKKKNDFLILLKENYFYNGCSCHLFDCTSCPLYEIYFGTGCYLYWNEVGNSRTKEERKNIILEIIKQYYGEETLFDWLV